MSIIITPPMTRERAEEIAASFDLRALPPDFHANPYPVYQVLRETQPVRPMPDGSFFLTRYADLVAVYRDAQVFSSDKKVEFAPKYGLGSPLLEHHTTSLVFNDPPLHTRVRRLIMGALTRLIQGDGDEQLGETELLQNCVFILNAGHETTTNLIGNALVSLQEWPDATAELSRQLARGGDVDLAPAVDEFLRFESSNQLGNRRATRATTVGGVELPAGALVTLGIGAANRDPAQFADPDRLQLTRADNRHLAFGFGIHQCAGLSLARLEARVAIAGFLRRFPDWRLTASPTRGGRARFRGFLQAPFSVA